jgi:L-fuculose-phosphate aldolase
VSVPVSADSDPPSAPAVEQDRRLVEDVAWACRILAMHGYEDLTLGHVSVRGSDDHTVYIKRKGVALSEVAPADVLTLDLRAQSSNGAQGMHLETVLHTEVYKRRPDVRSVVHGHPLYATAFGATDAEFAYLTHDSVLFVDGISTYDGVPDLIVNEQQGAAVAEALGAGSALLLRNHGVLVAERDVRWAVLASVLLERAIQLQAISTGIGPLHPIPQRLLEGIHAAKYQANFAGEYWDAWVRSLRRSGRALGMPGVG